MSKRTPILTLALAATLVGASCKSREPTPEGQRPTIESLDPSRVCFPRSQPDNRGTPSAATAPTTTTSAPTR